MLFCPYHKQAPTRDDPLCFKTNGNFIFENKSAIEILFMHQNAAKCTKEWQLTCKRNKVRHSYP